MLMGGRDRLYRIAAARAAKTFLQAALNRQRRSRPPVGTTFRGRDWARKIWTPKLSDALMWRGCLDHGEHSIRPETTIKPMTNNLTSPQLKNTGRS